MQDGITFGDIFSYTLVVVCTGKPWTVVVDVDNVYNDLSCIGIGWATQILSTNDQFVRVLKVSQIGFQLFQPQKGTKSLVLFTKPKD